MCKKFPRNQLPLFQLSVVILEGNFLFLKEFLPDHIHEQNTQEICKFTHFPGISYTIVQEQNSRVYARGTWDMRNEIEIMGKNDPLSII
jgi:hypothetical protein